MARIERALVSVSNKDGVVVLCQKLVAQGTILLSTGGTARALREAGIAVTDVSEYTGSPEIMEGRVKTLHPRVHGGILMRDLDADRKDLARVGGAPIDLVVCNLYPFEATVARGAAYDEAVENIDIGGPCMIRAAAKNHARVAVVVDPADYDRVAAAASHGLDLALRTELACKAFAHTASYDKAVADYLARQRSPW
jgi:phosphoribosylaminoimidazolecarboxamide formyltransferase/IMP cyclohydrolase